MELHPYLAQRFGIDDGESVEVTSHRGVAIAPARITPGIRQDTVFMPFHFAGEQSANQLTNDATDPISGMPEFKVCAVTIRRAEEEVA